MAYKLALPTKLAGVHDVFHVPRLRKCEINPSALKKGEPDPSHIVDCRSVKLQEDMSI